MEPTGHYWFYLRKFLQDNGMKSVLVNPHHVKKSKELDDNNPTKNNCKPSNTSTKHKKSLRFCRDGMSQDYSSPFKIKPFYSCSYTPVGQQMTRGAVLL